MEYLLQVCILVQVVPEHLAEYLILWDTIGNMPIRISGLINGVL